MKTSFDLKKIVEKFTKQKTRLHSPRRINPVREWVVGLGFTSVLFLCAAGYAGYEFFVLSRQTDDHVSVETNIIRYNQERVSKVLDEYDTRSKEFESLRAQRSNKAVEVITEEEILEENTIKITEEDVFFESEEEALAEVNEDG